MAGKKYHMRNLFGIIVIYNKNAKDSVTYQCLKRQEKLQIIVCDNSTSDCGNKKRVEEDGNYYIDMDGNEGLSKAYNKALDYIERSHPDMQGFAMLFDDDTFIPDDYFQKMSRAIKTGRADIYLPIVQDEIGILSPSIMKKYYCHRAWGGDVWKIKKSEICGINSGMAISLDIFKQYRYNEEIFLDYVDHNFLRDMRKYHRKIAIVKTYIQQTFSSNVYDKEKELARLDVFKKDINVFYKEGFVNRMFFHYTMLRRKMKLAVKYKKIDIMFR